MAGVLLLVTTTIVEVLLPPIPFSVSGFGMGARTLGPFATEGETVIDSITFPEKPPRLETVTVEVPDAPCKSVRGVGEVVRKKSEPAKVGATITETVTVWESGPLVPVMLTV